MIIRIFLTFLIWALTYPILVFISAFVVAYRLQTDWDGKDSLFGNRKYGRLGNGAYPCTNKWESWNFLVVRNPISNFGKETMSVTITEPVTGTGDPEITDGKPGITGYYYARSGWKWEIRMVYKTFPGRCFEGRWGWKLLGKTIGDRCTFVCRANPFKKFG